MGIKAAVQDRPGLVTSGLTLAVLIHAWASDRFAKTPDFFRLADLDDAPALFMGLAGVAAMVAGFSGVVVVFAMTQNSSRFARMRVKGGLRLEANWVSPVSTAFVSAFVAVGAATLAMLGHSHWASWNFELAVLLTIHAALRLVWLLRHLVAAVRQEDMDRAQPSPSDVGDLMRQAKQQGAA